MILITYSINILTLLHNVYSYDITLSSKIKRNAVASANYTSQGVG